MCVSACMYIHMCSHLVLVRIQQRVQRVGFAIYMCFGATIMTSTTTTTTTTIIIIIIIVIITVLVKGARLGGNLGSNRSAVRREVRLG